MSNLVSSIDAEIEKRSLLKHPFYKSWSAGTLTRGDLAVYSKEYFQMVKAVPKLVASANAFSMDAATREAVAEIQKEENEHIGMWTQFARALGVEKEDLARYAARANTVRAIGGLERLSEKSLAEVAATMYAIEREQPKISRTKLDGLKKFYGMDGAESGTLYFREHESADVRHAAVWKAILDRVGPDARAAALDAAILSLRTQNAVLDSVMESCGYSVN